MDLWFLCFFFSGDVQSLLHFLFCVRFDIFIEVIWVLESLPLTTVSILRYIVMKGGCVPEIFLLK